MNEGGGMRSRGAAVRAVGTAAASGIAGRPGQSQVGWWRPDRQIRRHRRRPPSGRADNPAIGTTGDDLAQHVRRVARGVAGQLAQQQNDRDVEQIDPGTARELGPQRTDDLGKQQRGPDLGQDDLPLRLPGREHGRVAHIGQVAMDGAADPDLDQAIEMLGAVRPVGPQPDQAVAHLRVRQVRVDDGITGPLAQLAEQRISPVGQVIEPAKAEIPEIGQHQAADRQGGDQVPGADALVLAGIGRGLHGVDLLRPDIEGGDQLAGQQSVITGRDRTQPRQGAGNPIQGALVEGVDAARERRQRRIARKLVGQFGTHVPKQALHELRSLALDPDPDRFGRDINGGLVAQTGAGEQTPDPPLAGRAAQQAHQQASPQQRAGQNLGTAAPGTGRRKQGRSQRHQLRFDQIAPGGRSRHAGRPFIAIAPPGRSHAASSPYLELVGANIQTCPELVAGSVRPRAITRHSMLHAHHFAAPYRHPGSRIGQLCRSLSKDLGTRALSQSPDSPDSTECRALRGNERGIPTITTSREDMNISQMLDSMAQEQ